MSRSASELSVRSRLWITWLIWCEGHIERLVNPGFIK